MSQVYTTLTDDGVDTYVRTAGIQSNRKTPLNRLPYLACLPMRILLLRMTHFYQI